MIIHALDLLTFAGVELKTAHYNAALRVQMENKHKFVATDVLTEMQASDEKKPNRVRIYYNINIFQRPTRIYLYFSGCKSMLLKK